MNTMNFSNSTTVTTKNSTTMNTESLSKRERRLWNKIRPNSGVVFMLSNPGMSKSSTARSIADKLGMRYIDLRLSTMDETDLGVFPRVKEIGNVSVVTGCVPEWAFQCSDGQPTLIHFEELNRAPQNVRNAALGVLLERQIGQFKLPDSVFMVSSGNHVSNHDSDVQELGTALLNRMVFTNFTLTIQEWRKEFAESHGVDSIILDYLSENPNDFIASSTTLEKIAGTNSQYPSPRSWTFLSDYLTGLDKQDRQEALFSIEDIGSYVGDECATRFVSFAKIKKDYTIEDVLDGDKKFFKALKDNKIDATNLAQLCNDYIMKYGIDKFVGTDKQLLNLQEFMRGLSEEQLSGFTATFISKDSIDMDISISKLLSPFKEFMMAALLGQPIKKS